MNPRPRDYESPALTAELRARREARVACGTGRVKPEMGRGSRDGMVRIVPEVRACTEFFPMNLMDCSYSFAEQFDIIFCRNVLIYFDRENQERILQRLTGCLKQNGYLFIGHSETVTGYNLPVRCVEPTVYRRS